MNLSGYSLIKRKNKALTPSLHNETEYHAPPPKIQLHNDLANLTIDSSDNFHFSSKRLSVLRKQNVRANKPKRVPKKILTDTHKLTVVLDLDETLVHSKLSSDKRSFQDMRSSKNQINQTSSLDSFRVTLSDGEIVTVFKRPGLDAFLSKASEKYELMVYTAGLQQYAEPLLNWLDPQNTFFRHRFYRESCLFTNGYYVKDLEKTERDMKKTVLVDNNLCCFLPQLHNGIPIASFYDDEKDDALSVLKGFLETIENEKDVRKILTSHFKLKEALGKTREILLG